MMSSNKAASKNLSHILSATNKRITEAKNPLARLYRQILSDLNVSSMAMNNMMAKYLADPRNRIPNDPKRRSSERGNLMKELSKNSITWKVFEKGIRLLGPEEMTFEVHLKWNAKRITIHGLRIRIHDNAIEEDNYVYDMVAASHDDDDDES